MKKLFLIGLVLFTAQASFGQSFFQGMLSRLSFGVKAGGNYSNFTGADFDTEGLAGFHAGLTMNFKLSESFSIQEDILYSTQGAKLKDNNMLPGKKIELAYLSVPILLRYQTPFGLYLEAGPQANMLITDAKDTGFEDFADKVDAGVSAGIGYQFKEGPVKGLGIGANIFQSKQTVSD